MVRSPGGISCCLNSTGNENAPMKTRIRIGTTVQATSSGELCVKPAGFGFDRRLKRTTAMIRSAVTNTVIAPMISNSM